MIARRTPPFIDIVVSVLGVWTIYAHASVMAARSFSQLLWWSWLPLVVAVFLTTRLWRTETEPEGGSDADADSESAGFRWSSTVEFWMQFTLLGAVVLAFVRFRGFWLLALVHGLLFNLRETEKQPVSAPPPTAPSRADDVSLIVVALLAVLFTLFTHRPDPDDAYFLAESVAAVDHPDLPLLSFDSMHGNPELPSMDVFHKPEAFSLMVATASAITGLPAATHYYFVFPALFAFLFAISNWLLLNRLAGKWAWLGLVATFVVLVVWGDEHESYGNFALIRLFQGKAVFVSVFVPLTIYYTLRFAHQSGWREWVLLFLVQTAAIGCASTAALVTPLCSALALLACSWPPRQRLASFLTGALTWSYAGLILVWLLLEKQAAGVTEIAQVQGFLGMQATFGERASVALVAIVLLPLLAATARLPSAGWLGRYVPVVLLFVLNEGTNMWVARFTAPNISWRIFWAIPVPLLLGSCFAAAVGTALRWYREENRRKALACGAATLAVFALFLGFARWTIAESNKTKFGAPKREVHSSALEAAQVVVANTTSDDLVLCSWQVSTVLTGFHDGPQLILSRPDYGKGLVRIVGKEEATKRYQLSCLVSGLIRDYSPRVQNWALDEVKKREIAAVVLNARLAEHLYIFRRGLERNGFTNEMTDSYEVWTIPQEE